MVYNYIDHSYIACQALKPALGAQYTDGEGVLSCLRPVCVASLMELIP